MGVFSWLKREAFIHKELHNGKMMNYDEWSKCIEKERSSDVAMATKAMCSNYCPIKDGLCSSSCIHFQNGYVLHSMAVQDLDLYMEL